MLRMIAAWSGNLLRRSVWPRAHFACCDTNCHGFPYSLIVLACLPWTHGAQLQAQQDP
jgi:hypothetical protein